MYSLDIQPTLHEIMEAYHNVEKWNRPEKPGFDLNWFVMGPHIRKDPKGVVLIISPFNFPILLILGPLVRLGCSFHCLITSLTRPLSRRLALSLLDVRWSSNPPSCHLLFQGSLPTIYLSILSLTCAGWLLVVSQRPRRSVSSSSVLVPGSDRDVLF